MAEIINLRRARKAKARVTAAGQADANRIAFGRTRAERQATAAEADRARRLLDGAKREE
ncbi:hypothetical protein GCM10022268_09720 [Sphingomonas cynarae]|uniref:DUF4169 family protein n=1 Tax=Sphingomonas cynarae TaxID=930197 RepID=A0ABP7DBD3_9SPHN